MAITFNIAGSIESKIWNGKLKSTYIKMINKPYLNESIIAVFFDLFFLLKYETVIGIMGNTHGVINAKNPPSIPNKNIFQ